MEVSMFNKEEEFEMEAVFELTPSLQTYSSVLSIFTSDSGKLQLLFKVEPNKVITFHLPHSQLFKLGPVLSVCIAEASDSSKEGIYSRALTIQFRKKEESNAFHCAFEQWKSEDCSPGLFIIIHMAPFSDEHLYVEIANKALFWQQQNYYGVNLTSLHGTAFQGYFTQPVVDAFDPRLLVAPAISRVLNFTSMKEEDLYEIDIPLKFIASIGGRIHGLACWFDVLFDGSTVQRWLTTAPGAPTTHWYQLRCVLSQPLYVMAGQEITGRLHMVAHEAQSYTLDLTLSAKMYGPGVEQGAILQTCSGKLELKEPYYRMSQPQAYPVSQDQQPQFLQTQDEGSDFLQHFAVNF